MSFLRCCVPASKKPYHEPDHKVLILDKADSISLDHQMSVVLSKKDFCISLTESLYAQILSHERDFFMNDHVFSIYD